MKMKDKEYHVANFATFVSKNVTFFPQKMDMNLISDRLRTASIKYLNWPSPVFGWFKNGCNKVVIEPRVVQFWSEIILVILKPRVWFQPKLHSTQFNYHYLLNCYVISRVLIFLLYSVVTLASRVFSFFSSFNCYVHISYIQQQSTIQ